MSFVEFSHFLHITRVYHAYKDLSAIKGFVLETKRRLVAASESKREEPSEEFLSREEVRRTYIHYLATSQLPTSPPCLTVINALLFAPLFAQLSFLRS